MKPTAMQVIAIFGPTGVGKTDVAVALAHLLRAEGEEPVAVSADALQIYRGLEILTGVANAAQQQALEHRLISFMALDESCTAGRFAKLAHAEIDELLAEGRRPIVLGGTGLYLRAALTELDLCPPPSPGMRERRMEQLHREGPAALHAELSLAAPWAAQEIDPADRQRLVRALELLDAGQLHPREHASQLWTSEMRRPTLLIGLTMPREQLYARIEARVDAMVAAGAREEALAAQAAGASGTARKALGFQELIDGDIDAMKQRTRNYAKRQLTWMRKLAGAHLVDVGTRHPGEVAAEIAGLLASQSARPRAET
jgi:tRNA dimethylallyltransferase